MKREIYKIANSLKLIEFPFRSVSIYLTFVLGLSAAKIARWEVLPVLSMEMQAMTFDKDVIA